MTRVNRRVGDSGKIFHGRSGEKSSQATSVHHRLVGLSHDAGSARFVVMARK